MEPALAALLKFAEYLETYRGRDKVIRLLSYFSELVAALTSRWRQSSHVSKKFSLLGSYFSSLRTGLRLFDDLSSALSCANYGVGRTDEDLILRCMTVISNAAGQLYYLTEHVAWARDQKLFTGSSDMFSFGSLCLWLVSIFCDMVHALRSLQLCAKKLVLLYPSCKGDLNILCGCKKNLNLPSKHQKECHVFKEYVHLMAVREKYLIVFMGNAADFVNAVNWLPPGFLWSGKLPGEIVGLLGTVSSVFGIYRSWKQL